MCASATSLAFAPSGAFRWTSMYSGIVRIPLRSFLVGVANVLGRDRVADRVGRGEGSQPIGERRHRTGKGDPEASFHVVLVAPALHLDEVGEDRRDDRAMPRAVLLAGEGLAKQRERALVVASGARGEPKPAKRLGLGGRAA